MVEQICACTVMVVNKPTAVTVRRIACFMAPPLALGQNCRRANLAGFCPLVTLAVTQSDLRLPVDSSEPRRIARERSTHLLPMFVPVFHSCSQRR
jgi:hypothetical protein